MRQLQVSPQIDETSLTQTESHLVLQQYESDAQMSFTHVLHPVASFTPAVQSECAQAVVPLHVVSLQMLETSPTQMLSHAVVQQ
jgi:hypothetical protein